MRFYWTLKGIPELQGLDWSERWRRWQRALGKAFLADPITAIAFLIYMAAFLTVTVVAADFGVSLGWRLLAVPIVVLFYHLAIQARVRRFIEPNR